MEKENLQTHELWIYRKTEYYEKPELYSRQLLEPVVDKMKKKVEESDDVLASLTRWVLDHQAGIAFNLITLLFLSHILPRARPYTTKFFALSYYNEESGRYGLGFDDAYFMTFCVVLLSGLRAGCMELILEPFARRQGLVKKKDVTRFAEQAWMPLYYAVFWTMGMYIWRTSPYYLNLTELWTDWPSREIGGLMKWYYLTQWAFWIQQLAVLHMEEPRKDYWQMVAHHLVTIALVSASYTYHFTRVGNLILITMDIVDIIFPLAKCTKYLGYKRVCNMLFSMFVIIWLATRHVLFIMIIQSVYVDLPREVPHACFRGSASSLEGPLPIPEGWLYLLEPFWNPQGMVCFHWGILSGFLAYLVSLQVMMVIWSYFIMRVAARAISGDGVEDPRSDDEGDEEEDVVEFDEKSYFGKGFKIENTEALLGRQRSVGMMASSSGMASQTNGKSCLKALNRINVCDKKVD